MKSVIYALNKRWEMWFVSWQFVQRQVFLILHQINHRAVMTVEERRQTYRIQTDSQHVFYDKKMSSAINTNQIPPCGHVQKSPKKSISKKWRAGYMVNGVKPVPWWVLCTCLLRRLQCLKTFFDKKLYFDSFTVHLFLCQENDRCHHVCNCITMLLCQVTKLIHLNIQTEINLLKTSRTQV